MFGKSSKKSSLFMMLIGSYILFTMAVIIIGGVLILFANANSKYTAPLYNYTDYTRYDSLLKSGRYIDIPVDRMIGADGEFQILDKNYKSIYKTSKDLPDEYTESEMEWIIDYSKMQFAELSIPNDNSGNTFITIREPREDAIMLVKSIVLDSNMNVIDGYNIGEANVLTDIEYKYLRSTIDGDYSIMKREYEDASGNMRTMIVTIPIMVGNGLGGPYGIWIIVEIAFVIIYVILVIVVGIWLNKIVKRPIGLLNNAMNEFISGNKDERIIYSGPHELEQICSSYNIMVDRLVKTENDRDRLERDKSEMLADISHDLKTPITVIKGYSKAVLDGLISDEEARRYILTIYNKSNVLTDLIEKFYEYNKLQRADFEPKKERTDICELVRNYLADKYDELYLAGHELIMDIPEKRIWCNIDRLEIRRVFDNIVINAIKHNNGRVDIIFNIDIIGMWVRIQVGDNGIGIGLDMIDTIFEPFVVGDASRNNKHGSGLGLAIVKRIIDSHDGHIRLVYPPDDGFKVQFEILLPIMNRK